MRRGTPTSSTPSAKSTVSKRSWPRKIGIFRGQLLFETVDFALGVDDVGVPRRIAGFEARELGLERLQPVLRAKDPLSRIGIHLRVRTDLRELRLEQHALRIEA